MGFEQTAKQIPVRLSFRSYGNGAGAVNCDDSVKVFRTFFLAVEFEKEHSRKSEKGAEGKVGKSLQKNGES